MNRSILSCLGAALLVGALLAAGAGSAAAAPAVPAIPNPGSAGQYVAVTPVRAVDTRAPGGGGAVGQAQTRTLDLRREVPSTTATAVVLNLTVDAPTAPGYVTLYPADTTRPTASSINKRAAETRSNSVTVALPADGSRAVDVFNQAGSTQVVLDVLGYYDSFPGPDGATYFPLDPPTRLLDSRQGEIPPLGPGAYVNGVIAPPPSNVGRVSAVAANVTAVDTTGPGFLTAWNGTGPQPAVSTVNYGTDAATPNFAIIPVFQDGFGNLLFRVENNVASADIVVDVLGYYAPGNPDGLDYAPVPPTRVADTRTAGGPLTANQSRSYHFDPGFPVGGLNLDVVAVDATRPTFLSLFEDLQPKTSTLNPGGPGPVANAAQTGAGYVDPAGASFTVYNSQGVVDFAADLQGYFIPATR